VKVRLLEQPFRILNLLLAHPGEVTAWEEIRKLLWPSVPSGHTSSIPQT
jgi:DNA-binding winged helix-turn-helix (wHTH) protein